MENSKIFVSHPYKSFVIKIETSVDGQGLYTWDPVLIIHNYSNEPFAIIGLKIRLGFKNSEPAYDVIFHSSTEITELPFIVQKESRNIRQSPNHCESSKRAVSHFDVFGFHILRKKNNSEASNTDSVN